MANTSLEVLISEDLKQRLQGVAEQQGKSLVEAAREALYIYVEDYEDGAMADVALTEDGLTFHSAEREKQRALDRAVHEASRPAA